jgi:hypothetical protein
VTQFFEVRAPSQAKAMAAVTSAIREDPDEGQDPYRYLKQAVVRYWYVVT